MRRLLAIFAGGLALAVGSADGQSLYPNQIGGCGLGGVAANCPVSGGGGRLVPPAGLSNDLQSVWLTNDSGTAFLTGQ